MAELTDSAGRQIGLGTRVGLCVFSGLLLAGFAVAASLEPDPRGYGTHQRLGLPECSFQMLFVRPCPGCGMTTSFAHYVRGQWPAAARANPAGLLLALTCTGLIPWCLMAAALGRWWLVDEPLVVLAVLMTVIGGVGLLVWVWRLWT